MERILLVEDDDMLAEGLQFALSREQFEVERARTAREALALFEARPPGLLLLDVLLPDGNGFEVCREIRRRSKVPVLFLTACDEEVNVVKGLELGGDDYIAKPFRIRELVSRIRANLRRTESAAGTASAAGNLESGAIVAFPLEARVEKSGKAVLLTPVELKLLLLLMRHPLQTLTRDQLLDKLGIEQSEFIDDNTLSVYIRRLREKLEERPSSPEYIVTVRGVGYKWNRGTMGYA